MFQKLRLKLTLINVAIILALFFLLICGTYFFAKIDMTKHTQAGMQRITADIQAGKISDLPQRPSGPGRDPRPPRPPSVSPSGPPPGPNFFFVKTSPEGAITFQSSNQPLDSSRLTLLTNQALQATANLDTLIVEETNYTYLKTPLDNQSGTVIVFHDLTQETNMLQLVLTTLLAVGLICAILSFGASFYMANRAMVPIKKAWRQQQDFLSDASHELRTPLTIIQTNLDIVLDSLDETVASQSKWLNNIQEESICMKNLVNSLLFLARADSTQQPLKKQLVFLDTVLRQAAAPFEAIAQQHSLVLEVHASSAMEVHGDEAQLKQVIAILLDNASRHTAPGGKISVSLSQAGSKIILTVSDSGEGIAAEHLDKIFDRFYQVDKSRNKGGSGLGLSIAKSIIESHGGSITVTSTPGEGTIFTVQLPYNSMFNSI
ncbi:Sensor protein SrrB [Sporomusa ovata DSM 2662]|uniref:histidine kinase n=1 Tax=Sporomusa ovata TaxID=2378 RepID=A0A0U1KX42_9FIRM|nr:ATP-binding protein [Sporomusa ovata]EQB28348.1 sensor histidine kinase ResE [Sporomusa ovata DSM 2662]CQR71987.1 Phosphate regulon sensor protein PhoR (SphS) [Sporomusa ovata]